MDDIYIRTIRFKIAFLSMSIQIVVNQEQMKESYLKKSSFATWKLCRVDHKLMEKCKKKKKPESPEQSQEELHI